MLINRLDSLGAPFVIRIAGVDHGHQRTGIDDDHRSGGLRLAKLCAHDVLGTPAKIRLAGVGDPYKAGAAGTSWYPRDEAQRLQRLGAAVDSQVPHGELAGIGAVLPAVQVQELQRQLPGLTGGEGVLESSFDGHRPVVGDPPTRPRTTADPLNRDDHLRSLSHSQG
jgi:hypothetical protein